MAKVLVIGAGNAGLSAAIAAREEGAEVVVAEAALEESYGSDSYFSGGLFRVAYTSLAELERITGPMGLQGAEGLQAFDAYLPAEFLDDWGRVTGYRCDPELAGSIVEQSQDALAWISGHGVHFQTPIVVDAHGRARHGRPGWHGGFVEASGAGPGLTESLIAAADKVGVSIRYGRFAERVDAPGGDGRWRVACRVAGGGEEVFEADAVVLASGGFQGDIEWRTRCLGPGWDLAKLRGSAHNTGRMLKSARDLGASFVGNWSGCHAVAWSVGSGDAGRRDANHVFERESYPFGITVNLTGSRFIDEGSDFGAYTYAKYGREILAQPEQTAWQLFDARSADLLTSEYRYKNPEAARISADSMEQLARQLSARGVDAAQLLETVRQFNAAVVDDREFSPYEKDGRRTKGLAIDKTNWARPLTEAPFEAFEVTCGVTFTFGGLRVDNASRVVDQGGSPIDGLYACGENVGGLYYFNYASGTGLTSGTVLGRRAGMHAAGGLGTDR